MNDNQKYYITKQGGRSSYSLKDYVVDALEDIKSLPIESTSIGSTVLVISTADVYVLNNKKQWQKLGSTETIEVGE